MQEHTFSDFSFFPWLFHVLQVSGHFDNSIYLIYFWWKNRSLNSGKQVTVIVTKTHLTITLLLNLLLFLQFLLQILTNKHFHNVYLTNDGRYKKPTAEFSEQATVW